MSYFKQAVEMMFIDRGAYNANSVEHLTAKLGSMEVEFECEKAAKTISLEQGDEVIAMNDLYMTFNGDNFDIKTLSSKYPILSIKLDELWCVIDSVHSGKLEEKENVPQSK